MVDMANNAQETEQESDDDDDGEVYFLKPVYEYNIGDKIQEANKELFGDKMAIDYGLMTESQQSRKVSFAANLEEYEPQNGISLKELEVKLGKDFGAFEEKHEQKLDIISEEETFNEMDTHESCKTNTLETDDLQENKSINSINTNESTENINQLEPNQLKSCINAEENIELEEICEEILLMDLESEKCEATECESPGSGIQRKMLKQITFDYTEDDDEIDNKSLTNLLMSDDENDSNDEGVENQEYTCNESVNNDTDSEGKELYVNTEYYNDEDEDDKLSIIVASYMSDDVSCDKTFLTPLGLKSSPRSSKTHKLPFNKRFSFRRKTKSLNTIGACSNHRVPNNVRFKTPPEVTDLKLHYKTCCDLKNAQQNLPKYTGYISEYGLSRQQVMERECKLQQKQQIKVVQNLKTSEAEVRKLHDNERAFTTWLKNKMRFPINKTRNMFDIKRPFGLRKCTSLGGNSLSNDTSQILNSSKYHNISAKLKKS